MASVGDIEYGQDRVGFRTSGVMSYSSAQIQEKPKERTKEIGKFIIGDISIRLSLNVSNAQTGLCRLTT